MKKITSEKIKRKLREKFVRHFRFKNCYYDLYSSYRKAKNKDINNASEKCVAYLAARPNPGAGIGHQLANWIAGYWYAKKFDINFAHIPFSNPEWEEFFGFYQNEKSIFELQNTGYKIVRIPIFDENNSNEVDKIRRIISFYKDKKVILLAEQDQFYGDQYGVLSDIQDKFYSASARENEKLVYDPTACNIAIHVRRGDIVQSGRKENPNLTMRFQGNDYFVKALSVALTMANSSNIQIYLFSQGKEEDFSEFSKFDNLHFCLDMDAKSSFLHMVYADILVTSKSSFSYKPALLNKGLKICPRNFWHGYPENSNWVLLDDEGDVI